MSGPPALLGIDLGTSSVKAAIVEPGGRVLATVSAAYPVEHPRPGWAESDPRRWWAAVVEAVRGATAEAGASPTCVGLSGQMHGVVLAGAGGEPVRPALLWSDSRAVEQLAAYRNLPDRLRARLRNPLTPGMAGPLLAWLDVHEARSVAAARWALQPKDWVRARLTGEFSAEPSDASATLLYDVPGDRWDAEVADAVGVNPDLLAPLLPTSGSPAGLLLPAAAVELGLTAGIPVAAGAADTAAAALGSGITEPGTAVLTIGSGAQIVVPVDRLGAAPAPAGEPVTHLYRAATDHGWYSMAAVLNGGLALDWVRRTLGAQWSELYAAAGVEPGPGDPMFLPHLSGERTPYLDPAMRGAWVGLAPQHDRQALLRAALEGVGLAVRDALDCLRAAGAPLTDLRLAGGGTTQGPWRQMLADLLGASLRPVDVSAASGRGAALLGGRAAGLVDEAAVRGRLTDAGEPAATPRAGPAGHYDDRYAVFRSRVAALRAGQDML